MSDLARRIRALEKAVIETGEDRIFVYLVDSDGVPFHPGPQGERIPLLPEELERWNREAGTVIRVRCNGPD
jgi:hypothetical protein